MSTDISYSKSHSNIFLFPLLYNSILHKILVTHLAKHGISSEKAYFFLFQMTSNEFHSTNQYHPLFQKFIHTYETVLVTPPVSPQTSHLLNCCGSPGSERLRLPVPLLPGDTREVPLVV